jgi:hypothetical protein
MMRIVRDLSNVGGFVEWIRIPYDNKFPVPAYVVPYQSNDSNN